MQQANWNKTAPPNPKRNISSLHNPKAWNCQRSEESDRFKSFGLFLKLAISNCLKPAIFECLKLSPPNLTFRNHLFDSPISQHSRYSMKQQLKYIYGQEPSIRSIVPYPFTSQFIPIENGQFHHLTARWQLAYILNMFVSYFGGADYQSNLQLLFNSQPGRELPCGNSIPAHNRWPFSVPGLGGHVLWVQSLHHSPQLSHLVQLSQPLANSLGGGMAAGLVVGTVREKKIHWGCGS